MLTASWRRSQTPFDLSLLTACIGYLCTSSALFFCCCFFLFSSPSVRPVCCPGSVRVCGMLVCCVYAIAHDPVLHIIVMMKMMDLDPADIVYWVYDDGIPYI